MPEPEALAFDMYGTLVDPIRIWKRLEQYGSVPVFSNHLERQTQLKLRECILSGDCV